MKVFISGASGLVGGNCLTYFNTKGWQVVGTHLSYPTPNTVYFNTLELNDPQNFNWKAFQPDAILHCGALTHVDYCEQNPEESYLKTVTSTHHIVEMAKQTGAKVVYISTDYVFDGKTGPYTESDAVNPLSVYGKHKLEAEQYVLQHLPESLVLRITNVYGNELRNKNFIARIIEQCKVGSTLQLRLPIDQYASPVDAYDIARALYLLLSDNKSGIYHIAGTHYVNRVELALMVLKFFPEAKYNLEAITTETLNQPAARPLRGGFIKTKLAEEFPELLFSTIDSYVQSQL